MSPEQAHGVRVDPRSDLFSLGSVLYTQCAGHAPFRAETSMAVLKRVCEDTPRPLGEVNADIPDWLEALIARLHAKDPADRFQTAAEVADLLGRHLAHLQQPGMKPPEPPTPVAEPETTSIHLICPQQGAQEGISGSAGRDWPCSSSHPSSFPVGSSQRVRMLRGASRSGAVPPSRRVVGVGPLFLATRASPTFRLRLRLPASLRGGQGGQVEQILQHDDQGHTGGEDIAGLLLRRLQPGRGGRQRPHLDRLDRNVIKIDLPPGGAGRGRAGAVPRPQQPGALAACPGDRDESRAGGGGVAAERGVGAGPTG
jgi:hypothetical protein